MVEQMLYAAVMSSSSAREYRDLFGEIWEVSQVNRFDLLVLRNDDIATIGLPVCESGRISDVIADEVCFPKIRQWIASEIAGWDISVPSLATYFPDITSANETRREVAIRALANTVHIAIDLTKTDPPAMSFPIVEMVCGTLIESSSANGKVSVYGAERKLNLLCESLREVVRLVHSEAVQDAKFAFALELEPGETYVLNDDTRIARLFGRLEGTNAPFADLARYVGLNIDIAHMRIARIRAKQLRPFLDRIVHAHVSDHPGIHTHDQFVGSWTNVQRLSGGYVPYVKLLFDRASQAAQEEGNVLPFTNAIAVELEGCNRIFSIHDSLSRLAHLIALVKSRYNASAS